MDSFSLSGYMGCFFPSLMMTELRKSDPTIVAFGEALCSIETIEERMKAFNYMRTMHGDLVAMLVLQELTSTIHELKHYHDIIGTPIGRTFLLTAVEQIRDLVRCLSVERISTVYLPLTKWAQRENCPAAIKRLSDEWVKTDLMVKYLFGDFQFECAGSAESHEPLVVHQYPLGELKVAVPCIPLVDMYAGVDRFYVLGAAAFLETSACALQSMAIDRGFGSEIASFFHRHSILLHSDVQECRYVVLSMLHNKLSNLLTPWQDFAIADYCLMGNPTQARQLPPYFHPGLRYLNRYANLKSFPWNTRDPVLMLQRVCEQLVDLAEVKATTEEYLAILQECQILFDKDNEHADAPFYQIQYLMKKHMKQLLDIRFDDPRVFVEPSMYWRAMENMPEYAPIVVARPGIWDSHEPKIEINTPEAKAIFYWPLMADVVSCIHYSAHLECPFIRLRLACTLKADGCQMCHAFTTPDKTCTFGRVLYELGIADKIFVSLESGDKWGRW